MESLNHVDGGVVFWGLWTPFHTYHRGKNGKDYEYVRGVIFSKRSMFVDELNIKLHPLLLKFIIDLFYNDSSWQGYMEGFHF